MKCGASLKREAYDEPPLACVPLVPLRTGMSVEAEGAMMLRLARP